MTRAKTTASLYCRSCGAPAPLNARFCAECGWSFGLGPSPTGAKQGISREERVAEQPSPPTAVGSVTTRTAASVGGGLRFGFGLAAGFTLFGIVAVVLVVLIAGVASGQLRFAWDSPPQPGMEMNGVGSAVSEQVTLDGTYAIEWTVSSTSVWCELSAHLKDRDRESQSRVAVQTVADRTPTEGRRSIEVEPGAYRLEVFAPGCEWSLRLTRP